MLWWYRKLSLVEPEFNHLSRSRIYEKIGAKVGRSAETTRKTVTSHLARDGRLMSLIEQTIHEEEPPETLQEVYGDCFNNKGK